MSNHDHYIEGFHGDGDSSIELHHGEPATWTGKMTVWSIVGIAVATVLCVVAIVVISSKGRPL